MSKFTKMRIMDAFMERLNEKSLDKMTVKDIIETAKINRNTFYYYFEDIYDLLHQVFLEKYEEFCHSIGEPVSFYEEYVRAADFLMQNRKTMAHIYHSKDQELLHDYLEKVTHVFVEYFVRKRAEGKELEEEGIVYLTSFYSDAIIENTMQWIREGMPPYREKYLLLVSKSFEASITDLIQVYQEYH